jgi:hypothetical protein
MGKWFRETGAEFYTISALAALFGKLRVKVWYRKTLQMLR